MGEFVRAIAASRGRTYEDHEPLHAMKGGVIRHLWQALLGIRAAAEKDMEEDRKRWMDELERVRAALEVGLGVLCRRWPVLDFIDSWLQTRMIARNAFCSFGILHLMPQPHVTPSCCQLLRPAPSALRVRGWGVTFDTGTQTEPCDRKKIE
jgi:hypothetical protein